MALGLSAPDTDRVAEPEQTAMQEPGYGPASLCGLARWQWAHLATRLR